MICNMCPRHKTCADAKNGCENCDIGRAFHEERFNFRQAKRDLRMLQKNYDSSPWPGCKTFHLQKALESEISEFCMPRVEDPLFVVAFTISCYDSDNNCIFAIQNDLFSESRFYIRGEYIMDVCTYDLPVRILEHYRDILPKAHSTIVKVNGIVEV